MTDNDKAIGVLMLASLGVGFLMGSAFERFLVWLWLRRLFRKDDK